MTPSRDPVLSQSSHRTQLLAVFQAHQGLLLVDLAHKQIRSLKTRKNTQTMSVLFDHRLHSSFLDGCALDVTARATCKSPSRDGVGLVPSAGKHLSLQLETAAFHSLALVLLLFLPNFGHIFNVFCPNHTFGPK